MIGTLNTNQEWRGFLEGAGLTVETVELHDKRHPLDAWLARTGCEGVEAERVRELLADRTEGDEWVDVKILLRARKEADG